MDENPDVTFQVLSATNSPFPSPRRIGLAWHYTSVEGLLGIFQSAEIWASSPRVLNDTSEVRYGWEVIREARDRLTPAADSPEALAHIDQILEDEPWSSVASSAFVLSASLESDLLNQWMHYSSSDGFAIGLNIDHVWAPKGRLARSDGNLNVGGPTVPGWYNVVYERSAQLALADNAMHWLLDRWSSMPISPQEHEAIPGTLTAKFVLDSLVLVMKHSAFRDEREVRFITGRSETEKDLVQYRAVGGRLVPYLAVAAIPNIAPTGVAIGLPIDAIVCGPGVSAGGLEIVRDMVTLSQGYPAVSQSSIPFGARR